MERKEKCRSGKYVVYHVGKMQYEVIYAGNGECMGTFRNLSEAFGAAMYLSGAS
jgi:hypothetical protein